MRRGANRWVGVRVGVTVGVADGSSVPVGVTGGRSVAVAVGLAVGMGWPVGVGGTGVGSSVGVGRPSTSTAGTGNTLRPAWLSPSTYSPKASTLVGQRPISTGSQ